MPLITVMKRSWEKEFREEGQHSGCQKVPITLIYRSAAAISKTEKITKPYQSDASVGDGT